MSEAAEADGCLSVLLMRPSGPLEREREREMKERRMMKQEEDRTEKKKVQPRAEIFSFKAEHWEAREAGGMFRGCRSSVRSHVQTVETQFLTKDFGTS